MTDIHFTPEEADGTQLIWSPFLGWAISTRYADVKETPCTDREAYEYLAYTAEWGPTLAMSAIRDHIEVPGRFQLPLHAYPV